MSDRAEWLTKRQVADLFGVSVRSVDRGLKNVADDCELIDRTSRPVVLSPVLVREIFGDSTVAELSETVAELSEVAELHRSEALAYRDDNDRLRLQAERDVADRLRDQVESLQRQLADVSSERDGLLAALHALTAQRSQPKTS